MPKRQWVARVFSWTETRGTRTLDSRHAFKLRVRLDRERDRVVEIPLTMDQVRSISTEMVRWLTARPFKYDREERV